MEPSVEITVQELMTVNVVSIEPDTLLIDAIQTMLDRRYSCMIIVQDEYPLGIITERDIVRLMAEYFTNRPQDPVLVRDVMSVPVATVTEHSSLFEALVVSSAQKIRHLPVVDGQGRIRGLVTQSDLAKAHFHIFEKQREIIEQSINFRTQELQQANKLLKELSMIDALMGIGNRRAMEVDLDHTHALALRYQRTYAVLLFDVDYFKRYNDTAGHPAGDEILRKISKYLQTCIRKSDRLYRYGGEEILMLLPETTPHGALILAGRIVEGLAELEIPHPDSPLTVITMSCGVACQTPEPAHASWQDVVSLADTALYAAKHSGRNRAHDSNNTNNR
jgi:diguanylate cyclase (GGDEF)-like protein